LVNDRVVVLRWGWASFLVPRICLLVTNLSPHRKYNYKKFGNVKPHEIGAFISANAEQMNREDAKALYYNSRNNNKSIKLKNVRKTNLKATLKHSALKQI